MSNYKLSSVQLATIFDSPVESLKLPFNLDRNHQDRIAVLDGAERAPFRLARLGRPSALIGVKVDRSSEAISVALNFLVDDRANAVWYRHQIRHDAKLRAKEAAKDDEIEVPDLTDRHRVLMITAQGDPVALAVLNLLDEDGPFEERDARQRVTFQIPVDRIDDTGLLMIGVEAYDNVGPDLSGRMNAGTVGLAVINARFSQAGDTSEESVGDVVASLSSGRFDDDGAIVTARPGFFVANPPGDASAYTIEVHARGIGGERLRGKRARVKHPARAVKEYAEDRVFRADAPSALTAWNIEGEPVELEHLGGARWRIPAATGPLMIRPTLDTAKPIDWSVRVAND